MFDLTTAEGRKQCVDHIESNTNKGRKTTSYQASEIYNDRIKQYVIDELREQFSESTVKEMPVVSSMNICKRMVNQLACVYSEAPEREFTELTPEQEETMLRIYDDMMANKKMDIANRLYKNHDQALIQVMPKNGKLIMRLLKPYQWDVVPMMNDPESYEAIIISAYDNYNELQEASDEPRTPTGVETIYNQAAENYKEKLASDELQKQKKIYAVFTMTEQFRMNEKGVIIGEVIPNPLAEFKILPFVEIAGDKEYEYWIRSENPYARFTKEFNAALSSVQQIVKMQGFAVGVLKGPQELLMQSVTIGPNIILKLPLDEQAGIKTEFDYVNPGSDIAGSIQYLEVLLTGFLSSNGIDPKTVTLSGEGQQYSSGIERLLSMIEKTSASKNDYDNFEKVEQKLYELVKAWLSVLSTASNLDDKYKITAIPDKSEVKITFSKPELIKSEMDELEIMEREIEMGISSPVKALMNKMKISREQAIEKIEEFKQDNMGGISEPKDIREGNLPDDQSQG